MQPELTLLAKMKQGDEEAFVALYRQHKDAVYRFALLLTGSHHLASDVTQETFMHFLSRPGQYDPGRGTIAAWLCGVARNMARKDARSREDATDPEELEGEGYAAHLLADNVTPLDRILKDETAELVRRAVAAIAPHYRDVLILCELSELSYAEAAQVCGIDIGTVRSRLSRARAQLADRLGRLGVLTTSAPAKEAVQ
ncbi:RNA polymerase sigma factor [Usitatibacter palustris]|nr:RNA polymerase sigma factor [Usitatibacter palustris]